MHIILQKIDAAVLPSDKMLVMWDNIETIREALTEPENIPHFTIDDILMKLNTLGSTHVAKKDVYNYISGDSLALEKYVGDPEPVIPDAAIKQEKAEEVTLGHLWIKFDEWANEERLDPFQFLTEAYPDGLKIIDGEKVTK